MRARRLVALTGALTLILLSAQSDLAIHAMPKGQRTKYGRVVSGGYDVARLGDLCLVFEGSMSSGDFFDGLEKIETSTGQKPTFRKKSLSVDHFPAELTFDLKVTTVLCSHEKPDEAIPQFASSLSFTPQGKAGMTFAPAEVLSRALTESSRPTPSRAIEHHVLRLKSENVPISSHVVVTVLGKEDEKIARVSVGL